MSWYGLPQTPKRFPLIQITNTSIPNAQVGSPYSFHLTVSGSVGVLSFTVTGSTGNWLSCNSSGFLFGTPTVADTENIQVTVTDATGAVSAPSNFTLTVSAAPPTGPNFPLVGGYFIAGSVQTSWGTTAFQQQVATLGVALIATFPGWTGGGFNMQSAAGAVKAINPNIKLGNYTNIMELEPGVGASGSAYSPIFNAATTGNWFLRNPWPAGPIVDADGNAQSGLNQTTFTNVVSGQNYLQWRAVWSALNEYPGSNWDAVYLDNVFFQPRITADYNQSGTSQTAAAAAQNWRNGYATYIPLLRAQLPATAQVWGNVADWFNNQLTGYSNLLDGGIMETFIGPAGGTLEATGWLNMMNGYKVVMQTVKSPGWSIFGHDGTAGNFAAMRYGFCSCLLDNAYYFFNAGGSSNAVTAFDETKFNLGQQIAGPNSSSTGTYSNGGLTVWKQGVWRRDFQNGIILVNPRGNGAQTVTLETTYWKLRQSIDTDGVNNAAQVTSVTLPDPNTAGNGGSGLFLSRTAT